MEAPQSHFNAGRTAGLGVRRRHVCFWPALLIFISVGYFQVENPGRNVNRQFALTCLWGHSTIHSVEDLLREPGLATAPADPYRGLALTDTQPVVSLLGAPTFRVYQFFKLKAPHHFSYSQARYSTRWLTIGLSSSILTALITLWLLHHGVSPLRSALASTLVIAATPLMGFSLVYSNDLPGCALAFWGYYLLRTSRRGQWGYFRLSAAGLLTGLAIWALPILSLPALLLTLWLMADPSMAFSTADHGTARRLRRLIVSACWLAGLLAGVSGWFIFTRLTFGVWWISPLNLVEDPILRQVLDGSFLGLDRPRFSYALAMLLGRGLGLFSNFPWLIVMLLGLIVILFRRRSAIWLDAVFAAVVFLVMLIWSSAQVIAWEGLGYAPRYLLGSLVFLWIGLTPWLVSRRRLLVAGVLALGLVGSVVNLVFLAGYFARPGTVSEEMIANLPGLPTGVDAPLFTMLAPGALSQVIEKNWGTELGLQGLYSLGPLAVLWLVFWVWLLFGMKKPVYPRSPDLVYPVMIDIGPPPKLRQPVLYNEQPDIHEHPHKPKSP